MVKQQGSITRYMACEIRYLACATIENYQPFLLGLNKQLVENSVVSKAQNNGRTSDIVRPKLENVRQLLSSIGHFVRWIF